MKEDAADIIKAIRDVYQKDTLTMGELADILTAGGYKKHEIRQIVRSAIESNQMGRVTYKNLGHSLPQRKSYVVIKPKPKQNEISDRLGGYR